jgi:GTP-binding protein
VKENLKNYQTSLYEIWEELPPIFSTSSSKAIGRKELLDYIDDISKSL